MKKIIFIFLLSQFVFSQSDTTLQDKIYDAIDVFVAHPTIEKLTKLESEEKLFVPNSNSEKLACVILKCNKAFYQKEFGQTLKAISSYEIAWQLYEKNKLSGYDIIEYCLKPLGNLYTIIGDYDNAENTIKQYFYIASHEKKSPETTGQQVAALLNLSVVYQNTGKIDETISLLEKAMVSQQLSPSQKGKLRSNLSTNYLLIKNNKKAEESFLKAIAELQNDKSEQETIANSYLNLSNLFLDSNSDKASIYFEKAKSFFAKTKNAEPRKRANFFLAEAKIRFRQEKFIEANKLIINVYELLLPNYSKPLLPEKKALYAETILLDALDLQAEIYKSQNQSKKALECYKLSFHVDDLLQSLLVFENSKIINQIQNRNRTEKCIAIYNELFQKEHKISYLEMAFELQEKTKSAVLIQAISNKKTRTTAEKILVEKLQNLKNYILKEQQNLDYADTDKIYKAIKEQNELMLQLKSMQANKLAIESTFKISKVYSKLENDNALLVEYFYGEQKIYVFTLRNNTIQLQEIATDLTSKVNLFLAYFSSPDKITNDVTRYTHDAFGIYKNLKLPTKSDNKNLIIIPDGVLNFFPFEALITKESKTTNFAKMHYLLDDFSVGYNNSATFYVNSIPLLQSKESVLGVFPIFENKPLELAFSKKEMQSIRKNFEGIYLDNEKATFDNFKINAPNFSILHLSTHASSGDIYEPSRILFSEQEILYSELYHLNINPNLVVLSACETGLGKLFKSEGAMSVARGFQFAGAQNLLFSLWKVNDYTTSVFMGNFYKNIKDGNSYFDANHQAKLSFLKSFSIPNAKKSPYYWSAFVYYGSLENNHASNDYFLWISIGIGIVLLILFIYHKRHKRKKNTTNLL